MAFHLDSPSSILAIMAINYLRSEIQEAPGEYMQAPTHKPIHMRFHQAMNTQSSHPPMAE